MKTQRRRKQTKKKNYGSSKIPMYQVDGPWYKLYWKLYPVHGISILKLRMMYHGIIAKSK